MRTLLLWVVALAGCQTSLGGSGPVDGGLAQDAAPAGEVGGACLFGGRCHGDLVCRDSRCEVGGENDGSPGDTDGGARPADAGGEPPAGGRGERCYPNGTCDVGLACADDRCAPDEGARPGSLGGPCLPESRCDADLTCASGTCVPAGEGPCEHACETYGSARCTDDGRAFHACGGGEDTACNVESRRIPCGDARRCEAGLCSGACTRPEMVVVVDRSSSMAGARWTQVRGALLDWAAQVDAAVALGVRLFPAEGCAPGEVVPLARRNRAALEAALADEPSPDAATPIAAALSGLAPAFGDPDESQFVVLITDGAESCGTSVDAQAAVRALRGQGIRTAVIGIGNGADPELMSALGHAGGVAPDASGFVLADDRQTLLAALLDLTARAGTCCVDADGDDRGLFCAGGDDCAPDEPLAWTGAREACDGVDNDCDGRVDDGLEAPLADRQAGVCRGLRQVCAGPGGFEEPDYAEAGVEAEERSCDGRDDDCDGDTDENLDRPCESECGRGLERCAGGRFARCDAPEPEGEVCNGTDDDCDGETDEGVANACGGCGAVPREVCGGGDDDCDGRVDEGAPDALCARQAAATVSACAGGRCQYTCDAGRRDANGDLGRAGGDGCEAAAWTMTAPSGESTCGLRGGAIECWGAPVDPPAGRFVSLRGYGSRYCALDAQGRPTCFGEDRFGGPGFPPPAGAFTDLGVGEELICGLRANGAVDCTFGGNPQVDGLDAADRFTAISVDYDTACGIRLDGTLQCWSWEFAGNNYNQRDPPPGDFVHVEVGASHACAAQADGTATCWGAGLNHCGEICFPHRNQSVVPRGDRFRQIAAGGTYTCGLRTDDTLVCWGDPGPNLDVTPPEGRFTQVAAGSLHACAIRADGSAVCWGLDTRGQTRVPD